jgi:glycerol-3-phosphate cytidylyltransferase
LEQVLLIVTDWWHIMKIGFTCGAFDLVHAGHIAMFQYCKQHCDYLIVGLHTDPSIDRPRTKNRPIQTSFERWLQLTGCKYIDDVVPYDTEHDLNNLLGILDINVRFIGEEYAHQEYTGKKTCKDRGIDIVFTPRAHSYSSSELRTRVKEGQ